MAVGAVFGAMNTMYAIVASRTREIGTLRALGFSRLAILTSFVLESLLLAVVAGGLGCLIAMPANTLTGATGQATFSEISFAFRVTPAIVVTAMIFAAWMGFWAACYRRWSRPHADHVGIAGGVARSQGDGSQKAYLNTSCTIRASFVTLVMVPNVWLWMLRSGGPNAG